MIKNIIFDFGGVIMTLDHPRAIARFSALGLCEAEKHLDAYTQGGIFGEIEQGTIDTETFRRELSQLCGRQLTHDECLWAWLGYAKEVPARNISILKELRQQGYRLIMLSNTNPYMMSWAMSSSFSQGLDNDAPEGMPACHYFDAVYRSYEVGAMKPDIRFYQHVLQHENIIPEESLFLDDGPRNIEAASLLGIHTLQPKNGENWIERLMQELRKLNA